MRIIVRLAIGVVIGLCGVAAYYGAARFITSTLQRMF